tara:strand:- start:17800 stop:19098 length:1299 start_codon:yes stop_codon:yes gene_type:complete
VEKRRIIFIGIENFNREYPGKKILSERLAKEGFYVLLGHKSLIRSIIKIFPLKNQIYIDKGVRKNSANRFFKAKKDGLHVFSFDEEGLIQQDVKVFLKNSHEPLAVNSIDGIFSWGDNHSKILKKAGYSSTQIIKTGNPRFDPYKIKNVSKAKESKNKEFILICSRFGFVNPNRELKESEISVSKDYLNESQNLFNKILLVPKILREAGIKSPIRIRPHPSESHNAWKNAVIGLEDISISNSLPVQNDFKFSKFLIHNRCTTSIEGAMNDLPIISYEPFLQRKLYLNPTDKFVNSFATFITTNKKELIDAVKILESNNYSKELFQSNSQISKYIYYPTQISSNKITKYLKNRYVPHEKGITLGTLFTIILLAFLIYLYQSILKLKMFIFDRKSFKYITQKNSFPKDNFIIKNKKKYIVFGLLKTVRLFMFTN